jgi:organic radical activating enzyme
MVFVRFSGCNLNCDFCDTDHEEGIEYTCLELLEKVIELTNASSDVPVCWTGGEPCLQLDSDLVKEVASYGISQHLETNGTICPPSYDIFETITISPKRPRTSNLGGLLSPIHAFKMDLKVVYDEKNLERTLQIINTWSKSHFRHKFLQPCERDGETNIESVLAFIHMHPDWRISAQLHKIFNFR